MYCFCLWRRPKFIDIQFIVEPSAYNQRKYDLLIILKRETYSEWESESTAWYRQYLIVMI